MKYASAAASALALALARASDADSCAAVADNDRVSCAPDGAVDADTCAARGCCFDDAADAAGPPSCFFPASGVGYSVGASPGTLELTGSGNAFSADLPELALDVDTSNKAYARFTISDPARSRYEVPLPLGEVDDSALAEPLYALEAASAPGDPFALQIARAASNSTVFDSTLGPLLYGDQFLQLSTRLPASTLYGLGEHISAMLLDREWTRLGMYSHDQGTPPGQSNNLYGQYPFAMSVDETDGTAVGYLLFNSNAMDVDLSPAGMTFRPIGGVLDMFVFMGPSPVDVIRQYSQLVGRPFMPPRWALGFSICRWGYSSVADMQYVVEGMRNASIPQDTQWLDIDGFSEYLDFTYDEDAFAGLPAFVDQLHTDDYGMRFVHIVDPGISDQQPAGEYAPFDDGEAADVWIRHLAGAGDPVEGEVWPGKTYYPDFLQPAAVDYWTQQYASYFDMLAVDAVWCDMNEVDSNVAGSTASPNCPDEGAQWDDPPYVPAIRGNLKKRTVCPSSGSTGEAGTFLQYDVHGLYGLSEMMATKAALDKLKPDERSFVLSRSTFPSAGAYGGHWLGDNSATWFDMHMNVAGMLTFNMFGVPFVGADIGGFDGHPSEELLARWMEVGAFAPFSRNHNSHGFKGQAPFEMGDAVAAASRAALNTRYELLPTLYTLFHRAHAVGEPVLRALSWQWPADAETHAVDQQFLWGADLLITPVLTKGDVTVTGYLAPAERWFDYYAGAEAAAAGWVELDAPLEYINLHQRGGSVLVTQEPAQTSLKAERNDMGLRVALDAAGAAQGSAFFDDYLSHDTLENGAYTAVQFAFADGRLTVSTEATDGKPVPATQAAWTTVRVAGLSAEVAGVDVDGAAAEFSAPADGVVDIQMPAGYKFGGDEVVVTLS